MGTNLNMGKIKNIRKSTLYSQTLAEVDQRVHEVSIFGDNQQRTKHVPEQPSVTKSTQTGDSTRRSSEVSSHSDCSGQKYSEPIYNLEA